MSLLCRSGHDVRARKRSRQGRYPRCYTAPRSRGPHNFRMPEPIAHDDAAALPADLSDVRRALHRALARRCPRWLSDRREDIVQVALMRLVQIQQRSERNTPFPASYLWKAAYSAMIDEIRRLRRAEHVSLEDEAVDPPAVDAGSDP